MSEVGRPSCEACKQAYKPRRWDSPALRSKKLARTCDTCRPPLMIDNVLAVQLFEVVQDQLIVSGMGQPVAVMVQAIQAAIEWCPDTMAFNSDDRWDLLHRVQVIGRTVLSLRNKEKEKKADPQPKARGKRGKGSN